MTYVVVSFQVHRHKDIDYCLFEHRLCYIYVFYRMCTQFLTVSSRPSYSLTLTFHLIILSLISQNRTEVYILTKAALIKSFKSITKKNNAHHLLLYDLTYFGA